MAVVVAGVITPDPLDTRARLAVNAASLDTAIAADALTLAFTITPAAIDVALPTEVTSPVRLAFVVTVVAAIVPVPVADNEAPEPTTIAAEVLVPPVIDGKELPPPPEYEGMLRVLPVKVAGPEEPTVVNVNAVLDTSIAAEALISALTIAPAAIEVVLPTEVTSPVRLAFVVTVPAVRPEALPVMFVPTRVEGVPRLGVTRVGDVANTRLPDPVSSVTAEARLALDGVAKKVATPAPRPDTPVEIGRPVA